MTSFEQLLPCPHCGAEAILTEHEPHEHSPALVALGLPGKHPGSFTIECVACECGMISDTRERVTAAWNRRIPGADLIEQQAARIAELEAENRSLRFVDLGSQAAEPYAYELHLPNDEYSLVYAAYLAKYATDEERACERLALYAAPVADGVMAKLFQLLMHQYIATSDESYLYLRCVGVPPTEDEFVTAVQRAIDAAIAAKETP